MIDLPYHTALAKSNLKTTFNSVPTPTLVWLSHCEVPSLSSSMIWYPHDWVAP